MIDSKALTDGLNIFVSFLDTIRQSRRSSRPGEDRNKSQSNYLLHMTCFTTQGCWTKERSTRDLWSSTCSNYPYSDNQTFAKLQEPVANLCGVCAKKYSHFIPCVLMEWEKQREQHGGMWMMLWEGKGGDENWGWIWKRANPRGSLPLFTELTAGRKLVLGTMVCIPNPLLTVHLHKDHLDNTKSKQWSMYTV